jgi:hypothetical protein
VWHALQAPPTWATSGVRTAGSLLCAAAAAKARVAVASAPALAAKSAGWAQISALAVVLTPASGPVPCGNQLGTLGASSASCWLLVRSTAASGAVAWTWSMIALKLRPICFIPSWRAGMAIFGSTAPTRIIAAAAMAAMWVLRNFTLPGPCGTLRSVMPGWRAGGKPRGPDARRWLETAAAPKSRL